MRADSRRFPMGFFQNGGALYLNIIDVLAIRCTIVDQIARAVLNT